MVKLTVEPMVKLTVELMVELMVEPTVELTVKLMVELTVEPTGWTEVENRGSVRLKGLTDDFWTEPNRVEPITSLIAILIVGSWAL